MLRRSRSPKKLRFLVRPSFAHTSACQPTPIYAHLRRFIMHWLLYSFLHFPTRSDLHTNGAFHDLAIFSINPRMRFVWTEGKHEWKNNTKNIGVLRSCLIVSFAKIKQTHYVTFRDLLGIWRLWSDSPTPLCFSLWVSALQSPSPLSAAPWPGHGEVCTAKCGQHNFSMLMTLGYVHQCQPMVNRCFSLQFYKNWDPKPSRTLLRGGTLPEDLERDQLLKVDTLDTHNVLPSCCFCAPGLLIQLVDHQQKISQAKQASSWWAWLKEYFKEPRQKKWHFKVSHFLFNQVAQNGKKTCHHCNRNPQRQKATAINFCEGLPALL